ncbi:hypothetical protein Tco_0404739 [Tanacetum coccineum]
MTNSLANRLYLKKKLYNFIMHPGKSQSEHIDEFHKLVIDLAAIDIAVSDEDQALLLLTSLPLYRVYDLAHLKLVFEFSIYTIWKSVRYGVSKGLDTAYPKDWIRRIQGIRYGVSKGLDTAY